MKRSILVLFFIISLVMFDTHQAKADVAGLVPCKDSKEFSRRLDLSVKKLEQRLKKYDQGTPPYLAIQKQIEKTKIRFDRYGKGGLLCGKDGLPHLITDGRLSHATEFIIPGLIFLYINGWIGWVGRAYLIAIRSSDKPAEKEIILDVPLALGFMSSGFLWPLSAWKEFTSGELLVDESEVTVSPR
uniref:Photosystem I reaction center subunit III n=1 Tax=Porphyridium sordidum TaxID=28024 RepID=A0A1C9CDK6_PORSO|nr:photosystem I subunit III [Porphyridium sordidum]AOM66481.1 photosystem I subunit III [Porphyridium sordidum]